MKFLRILYGAALNPGVVLVLTAMLEITRWLGIFSNPAAKVLWCVCGYYAGASDRVSRWSAGDAGSSAAMRLLLRRDLWFRRRVLAYIPLMFVTFGCYLELVGEPMLHLKLARGLLAASTWIHWGLVFAAFDLGLRVRGETFTARTIPRDFLYGPSRWLVPAVLAALSIGVDPFMQTLPMMAVLLSPAR
jgi:hypothetical protein